MKLFDWLYKKPNAKRLLDDFTLSSPDPNDTLLIIAVTESIALVQAIPHQYLEGIKNAVLRSITRGGQGLADLAGGGNNPFKEHIAMSGKIYRFDEPPIINSKTGQRGFPSDLPGCRCKILPITNFQE